MKTAYSARLLHSLRYGFLSSLWPYISIALVYIGGVRFAAFLCSLSVDWGDEKTGPLILCPFRESFVKDIHQLRQRTNFQFAIVMGGFTRFQESWVPKPMQVQTFYQSYRGKGYSRALKNSYLFSHYLIQYIQRKKRVAAVLSANFDYWQESGLKKVCKDINIPFIVLSREHPVVPHVCDVVVDWYKRSGYYFDGDAILVAGKSSKDVLLRVGSVCPEGKVVITGLPRFDAWRDVDSFLLDQDKIYVTLLTFTDGYYADTTFLEVLRVFVDSALKHSNSKIQFLIKTKDASDNYYIKSLIPDFVRSKVEVSFERDLFEILPQSKCVIGYNSLSMVEAIMAGSQLIAPAWGECLDRGPKVMYPVDDPTVCALVNFAYSSEELADKIDLAVTSKSKKYSPKLGEQFISKYVYVPKEHSSSQVVSKFLSSLILHKSGQKNGI